MSEESDSDVMRRMMIEIGRGIVVPPEAESAKHAAMRKSLTEEIKEIEAKGGIVEIPFDWP